ncbi:hypothetical protein HRI_003127600 [Hibiscus trionum]|uniref:Uncharacterized protein n=1 Tax=Hibiscus trionum TaxID=183268 RepID=A0A9W7IHZ9_HIBTR|nr:hypothetical protein HRI_003127600 [Hibiscus trionum]
MERSPCCIDASDLKRGPCTPEEDQKPMAYTQNHGYGRWRSLPDKAGQVSHQNLLFIFTISGSNYFSFCFETGLKDAGNVAD